MNESAVDIFGTTLFDVSAADKLVGNKEDDEYDEDDTEEMDEFLVAALGGDTEEISMEDDDDDDDMSSGVPTTAEELGQAMNETAEASAQDFVLSVEAHEGMPKEFKERTFTANENGDLMKSLGPEFQRAIMAGIAEALLNPEVQRSLGIQKPVSVEELNVKRVTKQMVNPNIDPELRSELTDQTRENTYEEMATALGGDEEEQVVVETGNPLKKGEKTYSRVIETLTASATAANAATETLVGGSNALYTASAAYRNAGGIYGMTGIRRTDVDDAKKATKKVYKDLSKNAAKGRTAAGKKATAAQGKASRAAGTAQRAATKKATAATNKATVGVNRYVGKATSQAYLGLQNKKMITSKAGTASARVSSAGSSASRRASSAGSAAKRKAASAGRGVRSRVTRLRGRDSRSAAEYDFAVLVLQGKAIRSNRASPDQSSGSLFAMELTPLAQVRIGDGVDFDVMEEDGATDYARLVSTDEIGVIAEDDLEEMLDTDQEPVSKARKDLEKFKDSKNFGSKDEGPVVRPLDDAEIQEAEDLAEKGAQWALKHASEGQSSGKDPQKNAKESFFGGFMRVLKGMVGPNGFVAKAVRNLGSGVREKGGVVLRQVQAAVAKYWEIMLTKYLPKMRVYIGELTDQFLRQTLPDLMRELPNLLFMGVNTVMDVVRIVLAVIDMVGGFINARFGDKDLSSEQRVMLTFSNPNFDALVSGQVQSLEDDFVTLKDLRSDQRQALGKVQAQFLESWEKTRTVDASATKKALKTNVADLYAANVFTNLFKKKTPAQKAASKTANKAANAVIKLTDEEEAAKRRKKLQKRLVKYSDAAHVKFVDAISGAAMDGVIADKKSVSFAADADLAAAHSFPKTDIRAMRIARFEHLLETPAGRKEFNSVVLNAMNSGDENMMDDLDEAYRNGIKHLHERKENTAHIEMEFSDTIDEYARGYASPADYYAGNSIKDTYTHVDRTKKVSSKDAKSGCDYGCEKSPEHDHTHHHHHHARVQGPDSAGNERYYRETGIAAPRLEHPVTRDQRREALYTMLMMTNGASLLRLQLRFAVNSGDEEAVEDLQIAALRASQQLHMMGHHDEADAIDVARALLLPNEPSDVYVRGKITGALKKMKSKVVDHKDVKSEDAVNKAAATTEEPRELPFGAASYTQVLALVRAVAKNENGFSFSPDALMSYAEDLASAINLGMHEVKSNVRVMMTRGIIKLLVLIINGIGDLSTSTGERPHEANATRLLSAQIQNIITFAQQLTRKTEAEKVAKTESEIEELEEQLRRLKMSSDISSEGAFSSIRNKFSFGKGKKSDTKKDEAAASKDSAAVQQFLEQVKNPATKLEEMILGASRDILSIAFSSATSAKDVMTELVPTIVQEVVGGNFAGGDPAERSVLMVFMSLASGVLAHLMRAEKLEWTQTNLKLLVEFFNDPMYKLSNSISSLLGEAKRRGLVLKDNEFDTKARREKLGRLSSVDIMAKSRMVDNMRDVKAGDSVYFVQDSSSGTAIVVPAKMEVRDVMKSKGYELDGPKDSIVDLKSGNKFVRSAPPHLSSKKIQFHIMHKY